MTAIMNAISVLNQALDSLESAAIEKQRQFKAQQAAQQELFANMPPANKNGIHAIDRVAVAKKLDVTIEKLEQVLREG